MHCTPTETLTARKVHRCDSCGQLIAVGDQYRRWRTYDQGDAGTSKMHPECLAMHEADANGGQWEYSPLSHERPAAPKGGA